jgi:alkylhydroperoxidase family enzyme
MSLEFVILVEVMNMKARMKNPAMILPGAMEALLALNSATQKGGVPQETLELIHLRVSQINGCSVCVDMQAVA